MKLGERVRGKGVVEAPWAGLENSGSGVGGAKGDTRKPTGRSYLIPRRFLDRHALQVVNVSLCSCVYPCVYGCVCACVCEYVSVCVYVCMRRCRWLVNVCT